jgi:type I restriction enzyme S subunit
MESRAFLDQVDRVKGQTDMAPYVSLRDQRRMSFRLPGAPEQQAIARPLRSLQDRIWNNVDESRTLAALRDLLLPRLLSGELRVRDAEREVGRVA